MNYRMTTIPKKSKRSIRCNGGVIRALREQQGLRQIDLASLAGYSVRLIGKAEAGKALSLETIETLAEALSVNGDAVTPEHLILNLRRIGQDYLRFRRVAKTTAMKEFLMPKFVLRVNCNIAEVNFESAYHGHTGLECYYRLFDQIMRPHCEDDSAVPQEHIFESPNDLICWSDKTWFLRLSSEPVLLVTRLTFIDGKLTQQEDLYTTSTELSRQATQD